MKNELLLISLSALLSASDGAELAGAGAATEAGPPRQSLEYSAGSDLRGYRLLEITTNPPPNVVLPKLNVRPGFAFWTTPLDRSGGRWLCLDRTRKSGPWDRLFVDANGNGRLDDELPVKASSTDERSCVFDPVRVVIEGEGGPREFHFALRLSTSGGQSPRLVAMTEDWYEGTVDFAGRKLLIQLIDANVNGVFNDVSAYGTNSDVIVVAEDNADRRRLGRFVEVDHELFSMEVARDGASVRVWKAGNVALGRVRVPQAISELTVVGENGQFLREPAQGECELPVGAYRVSGWTLNRTNEDGAMSRLVGVSFDAAGNFEVASDRPVALEIGEPLRAVLQATQSSKNEVTFTFGFRGRLGEFVNMTRLNRTSPQVRIASLDGKYSSTNSFDFG